MSGPSIKFRCQECGQLLGVARSKAGSPVGCPKCGETLFVPLTSTEVAAAPPAPAKAGRPPSATVSGTASWPVDVPFPSNPSEAAPRRDDGLRPGPSGPAFGLIDFGPEDIRVEGGLTAPPRPRWEPEPSRQTAPEPDRPGPRQASESETVETDGTPEVALQAIKVDDARPALGSRRATPPARPGDLVLPRAVVTAWSLFVLLALACAFVAGLLLGHFFWTAR